MSVEFNYDPERDDPVEFFLNDRNFSDSRQVDYRVTFEELRKYLSDNFPERSVSNTNQRIIQKWVRDHLRDTLGNADSTIRNRLSCLNQFYKYFSVRGIMDNPAIEARKDIELHRRQSELREIPIEEMRRRLAEINQVQRRTIWYLFLKTGIRKGELVNLDLRDINLDYREFNKKYSHITKRPQIRDRSDSLYIAKSREMEIGKVVNGEKREEGNKRSVPTIFPIDNELKRVLLQWLACRPDTPDQPAKPLFTSQHYQNKRRISGSAVAKRVQHKAADFGWYDMNEHSSKAKAQGMNVSPHYFRHYFVSHHRRGTEVTRPGEEENAIPESVLRYLRGDSDASDNLDIYTQKWSLAVKRIYNDNIYKFDV